MPIPILTIYDNQGNEIVIPAIKGADGISTDYVGATAGAAGEHGLVPSAASASAGFFLRGNGLWTEVTPSLISAAKKTITTAVTLVSTSWSSAYYTVSIPGLAANANIEIIPATTINSLQLKALQGANLVGVAQASGTFTIYGFGTVPTINIPITVLIRGDSY